MPKTEEECSVMQFNVTEAEAKLLNEVIKILREDIGRNVRKEMLLNLLNAEGQ